MAPKSDPLRIIGSRLQAYLVSMVVLLLLIGICILGAIAGVEGIRRRDYGDFMSPIWFVASAFGAVTLTIILIGMATETIAELLTTRQEYRGKGAIRSRKRLK